MNSLLVTCPKCGSTYFDIEAPAEITFNCFLKIPFTCKNCGYKGQVKILAQGGTEIEILVE
ncbi:MAG: hypothetical protein QXO03_04715 [Thermoplasmatales archaeon]